MSKTKLTPLFGTSNMIHSDVWHVQRLTQKQSTPQKNINCTHNTRETNKRKHIVVILLIAVVTLIGIVGCPSPNKVADEYDTIRVWKRVTETAGWTGRWGHTTVVLDDKIWVLGGSDVKGNYTNDVWSSSDGKDWTKVADAPWTGRFIHTTVVLDDKIWVLGGAEEGIGYPKDVWTYGLP